MVIRNTQWMLKKHSQKLQQNKKVKVAKTLINLKKNRSKHYERYKLK